MPLFLELLFDIQLPAFLVGLLLGSFLNVCISRLPAHRSIAKPRSHCPQCHALIRWYDNIPLLSFALLRGRCRSCKAPISWRYPVVELAMGLWFLKPGVWLSMLWGMLGPANAASMQTMRIDRTALAAHDILAALTVAILGFLLIGLAFMDWETHKLPDAFTLPGILIGLFLVCVQAIFLAPGQGDVKLTPRHDLRLSSPGSFVAKGNVFLTGPEHLVYGRLAAVIGAALLIVLIRAAYKAVRKQEGMGLGDAKLLAMIAAFLGFWPAMLAFFFGVILCALYAVVLLVRRKAHTLTRLPLGTFLAIGGLLSVLFYETILPWYSSLL